MPGLVTRAGKAVLPGFPAARSCWAASSVSPHSPLLQPQSSVRRAGTESVLNLWPGREQINPWGDCEQPWSCPALAQMLLLLQTELWDHPNMLLFFSCGEKDGGEQHPPAYEGFNQFSASPSVTFQLLCTSLSDATGPQISAAEMEICLIIDYEKDMVKNSSLDGGF